MSRFTHFRFPAAADADGRVEATIEIEAAPETVFFETRDAVLQACNEAFAALTVLPSMRVGNDIQIEGPISDAFCSNFDVICDIYRDWLPALHRIHLVGGERLPKKSTQQRGVGLFFSGGVDSSYTLLKHKDEITHLILLGGFERSSLQAGRFESAANSVRSVARELGKTAIVVQTSLRTFLASYRLPWGPVAFGAGQAAVAHLLSAHLARVYMAGGHTYAHLLPAGNHPLLDPRWGTETLQFLHDGLEADRLGKVRRIAQDERALAWLRVCGHPPAGALNCGRCEKCLRTMINLHVVGALERCTTLPHEFDLRSISQLEVVNINHQVYFEQNIRALQGSAADRRIARALQRAIHASGRRRAIRRTAQAVLPGPYRFLRRMVRGGETAQKEGEAFGRW